MSEPRSYTFQFQTTPQGAIDAAALVQPIWYHINTVIYVSLTIGGLVIFALGGAVYWGFPAVLAGVSYLAVFRTGFGMRWWVRRKIGRLLGIDQKITVHDAGLQFESPHTSGQIKWAGLTEIRQSDRAVVFLTHGRVRMYIPASAFASPTERSDMVAFARQQIASAAVDPNGWRSHLTGPHAVSLADAPVERDQGGDGAGDEVRTRDIQLGRLTLCQLSYSRPWPENST